MHRVATTFALSSWLGFVTVSAGVLLFHGGLPEVAPSSRDAQLAVLALLAAAASMSAALLDLHGKRTERRERGEWRGVVGLLIVAAVACAGQAAGNAFLPADVTDASFWVLLALGVAAIVFDRLMSVENDVGDDPIPLARAQLLAYARRHEDGHPFEDRNGRKP